MKITAITSAALLTLMALAGCGKSEPPDENPAPSAAPEPPYQAPQDTAPESMPPSDMPSPTDEGATPPSDSPSEPPKTPSG